ncbi:AIR synthase-related protein [Klebsiella pneumoniae]|nr:AIR synthase-related protein [Klebsiella pneumoniae]
MFAQANSEHCRHKIFNADWIIDGEQQPKSLFKMIKNTMGKPPDHVLSAYKDNAAVMEGSEVGRFFADREAGRYDFHQEPAHILMKVETHNHPTAISPWPGAATSSGSEIRDERCDRSRRETQSGSGRFLRFQPAYPGFRTAVGRRFRQARAHCHRAGYHDRRPAGRRGVQQQRIWSSGAEQLLPHHTTTKRKWTIHSGEKLRGYHKPIMLAGGFGSIRADRILKGEIVVGAKLIVLGGPAMNIGLGGGGSPRRWLPASLMRISTSRPCSATTPEAERRCQEVIDRCWRLGDASPILFIHDVGAGGLSNAMPELVSDGGRGGRFNLRDILGDEGRA